MTDPRLAHTMQRARSMRSVRTDDMRRALAHRICWDLLQVLRYEAHLGASSSAPEPARAQPVEGRPHP